MPARQRRGDGPLMNFINLLGIFGPLIFGAVLLGRYLAG